MNMAEEIRAVLIMVGALTITGVIVIAGFIGKDMHDIIKHKDQGDK